MVPIPHLEKHYLRVCVNWTPCLECSAVDSPWLLNVISLSLRQLSYHANYLLLIIRVLGHLQSTFLCLLTIFLTKFKLYKGRDHI